MEKVELKLNPLWDDKEVWRNPSDKANNKSNHWANAFREFYMDKLCPVEDIDYIEVTDEEKEKGWQTVQKQLDK